MTPAHPGTPGAPDAPGVPGDLAAILAEVVPPGGSFRHREHIHLAYLAVQRHGAGQAAEKVAGWIRHLAIYQRAPQKYHATVTRAWVEVVAHHMAAAPQADFADFAERYPALFDKRLLARHYSSRALASPAAKAGWLEPDLAAFPWHRPQHGPGGAQHGPGGAQHGPGGGGPQHGPGGGPQHGPRRGPQHDPQHGPHPAVPG